MWIFRLSLWKKNIYVKQPQHQASLLIHIPFSSLHSGILRRGCENMQLAWQTVMNKNKKVRERQLDHYSVFLRRILENIKKHKSLCKNVCPQMAFPAKGGKLQQASNYKRLFDESHLKPALKYAPGHSIKILEDANPLSPIAHLKEEILIARFSPQRGAIWSHFSFQMCHFLFTSHWDKTNKAN